MIQPKTRTGAPQPAGPNDRGAGFDQPGQKKIKAGSELGLRALAPWREAQQHALAQCCFAPSR